MPVKQALKSRNLDKKDREIIMILQNNGRESLTNIAKKIGLSIDSVKKRMDAMMEKDMFFPSIFVNPQKVGFPLVIDIKIKLSNVTNKQREEFIGALIAHPRVVDLFSLMGSWDFTCVIVGKTTRDLEKVSNGIREKFKSIISGWESWLVLETYKFEFYHLLEGPSLRNPYLDWWKKERD